MLKNILSAKKNKVFFLSIAIIIFVIVFFLYKSTTINDFDIDLLIENTTILTLNKNSEIIENGWIAVKNNKIDAIGKGKSPYRNPKKIIDAEGKVAMPGLINTHSHTAMTLLRGIDDDSELSSWLSNINSYETRITEDDAYWSSLLGEIEMIKSGTTTFNDMYFFEKSLAKSIKKTGMRAVIDIPFEFQKNDLNINQDFINKYKDVPTINFSLAPNPLINFSKENLEKISDYAEQNNFIIHIHIEEGRGDKNKFIEKYSATPLQLIFDSGILNNKTVLAHSINFTDEELAKLSKYENAGISFNPKSNFKLSGSTAPVEKMIEKNITISIGTDGAASSNSLDMFDQINFIAFIRKECSDKETCEKNQKGINPEKIIRMATIEGAKSLGLEKELGSIEVGKKADIILVNFKNIGLTPSYDIYSSLVYNTDGSDVSDSIINGEIIMRDRILNNINEKEVIEKVNSISKKIKDLK